MNTRREPGIGPAPTGSRPVQVTVNTERRGGNALILWLCCICMILVDVAIVLRIAPLLLDLWLGQSDIPLFLPELAIWLLALIAANLVFGLPALLARAR